ncbi:MAG: ABC transporter permease subunit [Dehalococcoidia bacterium]
MNKSESTKTTGISLRWLQRPWVNPVLTILALVIVAVLLQGRQIGVPDVPLAEWVDSMTEWFVVTFGAVFRTIRLAVLQILNPIESFFLWLPWPIWIAATGLAAYRLISWKAALAMVAALTLIVSMELWNDTMVTLGVVATSMLLTVALGVPIGILVSKSDRLENVVRPILDAMQTIPAFVYLIPVVMLLGTGKVPAVLATMIYAVPPSIRLTNLGLRQVSTDIKEAARSFGASPWQMLTKVELPLALKTILAGVNQSTMMAVAMVVIAALIGAAGLGNVVLFALQRVRIGMGFEAGLAILILAIILDRLTQALGKGVGAPEEERRE